MVPHPKGSNKQTSPILWQRLNKNLMLIHWQASYYNVISF